jgi:hypothetical protein
MNLPFTLEQLLNSFEKYNLAIWPMQVFAYLLGVLVVYFAIKPSKHSNKIIIGILSFLWLWTGIGFFMFYFGPLYSPAYAFGGLFIIQGIIFMASIPTPPISFGYKGDGYAIIGLLFIIYAMLGYPLVGFLLDHGYPQSPPFGLTPCPLALFTFGLLMMTDKKVSRLFIAIPLLWALGGFVPVSVGILEDIGLIVAGVLGTSLILYRDRKQPITR